jgi:uncharacterized protein (UPF0248 family)
VVYPREILNRLKWKDELGLAKAEISYLHRGAPNDLIVISGEEIVELEKSFFLTGSAKIPYHRIRKIVHRGSVLYDSERSTRH